MNQISKEKSDNTNNSFLSKKDFSPKDEIDNNNKYFAYYNEGEKNKLISEIHTNNQGFVLDMNIKNDNKNVLERINSSKFANKKITEEEFHGKIL